MNNNQKKKSWIPLDTFARMYPPLAGGSTPNSFRISCVLKEPVNPEVLRKAVETVIPQFPYLQHSLGTGLFWHFLQKTSEIPNVIHDNGIVCRDFCRTKNEKLLLRVLYSDYRISVESSHVLTDGYGARVFIERLVERYLIDCGLIKTPQLHPCDFTGSSTYEDSYRKYFIKDIPHAEQLGKTYQTTAQALPNRQIRLICGEIDSEALRKECSKYQVTITQYLAAIYLWSLYKLSEKQYANPVRNIRLIVPVDLRRLYQSTTMRNFFAPISCELLPFLGPYSFEDIVEEVKHQMSREISPRFINLQIARNVSITYNLLIRLIPLLLKNPIQRLYYFKRGICAMSGILSNIGKLSLPPELEQHIDSWELITSPNSILGVTLGIVGCKKNVVVTFCNTTVSTDIEREFFTMLSRNKIHTKIYTNYQSQEI